MGENVQDPKSKALHERRANAVAKATAPSLPGFVADANGGVVKDVDGNTWIDFASGIAATSVGASHPKVVEAVQDAVSHFTHTSFPISPYESYVEVAEILNGITPGDHAKKSVLLNSGAEAVENAMKIARTYTGRNAVVALYRAFHGRTNLTMAMTAKAAPYKAGFGPFAGDIYRAPASYPLRDDLSGADAAAETIYKLEKEIGASNIACVVLEPIQGEGGFVVPATGFIPALVKWCNDNGIDYEGVVPDLVTTVKGIAGGMPLSAVTGRAEIMDAAVPGGLGGTYGGNPVACGAAVGTLAAIREENLADRALEIESIIREELSAIKSSPRVAEVRGRGAMMAFELVDVHGAPDVALTSAIIAGCKDNGVLARNCGMDSNVVRLLPSLVIAEETLRGGLRVIVEQFHAATK